MEVPEEEHVRATGTSNAFNAFGLIRLIRLTISSIPAIIVLLSTIISVAPSMEFT
jgi:hypothetical protein